MFGGRNKDNYPSDAMFLLDVEAGTSRTLLQKQTTLMSSMGELASHVVLQGGSLWCLRQGIIRFI